MNIFKHSVSVIMAMFIAASAPTFAESNDSTITARINATGTVRVIHPDDLEQRLGRRIGSPKQMTAAVDSVNNIKNAEVQQVETPKTDSATGQKVAGYRVQVFSDNNPRTAKAEARAKAKEIANGIPGYKTYVVFTAPYWRLRVGDFLSKEEAEVAAARIKRQFPAYAGEVRIVRDKVNH